MDLFNFLRSQDFKIITCFKMKKYIPNLGFLLFSYYKSKFNDYKFTFVNNENLALEYQLRLKQFFLGLRSYYWFSDISLYKKPKDWEKLILNYSGPNYILLFNSLNKTVNLNINNFKYSDKCDIVEIPEYINKEEFIFLLRLFFNLENLNYNFIKNTFKFNSRIDMQSAAILINYYPIMGNSSEEFFSNWFNKINISEQSTFLLAQYFFARDKIKFFNYWFSFEKVLPIEYWISFFSEQLWQAILFIKKANLNITRAKKESKRLPFSFINKDWVFYKTKIDLLIEAHNELYIIDYRLKNGSIITLEVWLNKFFLR